MVSCNSVVLGLVILLKMGLGIMIGLSFIVISGSSWWFVFLDLLSKGIYIGIIFGIGLVSSSFNFLADRFEFSIGF